MVQLHKQSKIDVAMQMEYKRQQTIISNEKLQYDTNTILVNLGYKETTTLNKISTSATQNLIHNKCWIKSKQTEGFATNNKVSFFTTAFCNSKENFKNKFDIIILQEATESSSNNQMPITTIKEYLKPGGCIFYGYPQKGIRYFEGITKQVLVIE
jgi:hypothetical protein